MADLFDAVEAHYGLSDIGERILNALAAEGVDVDNLSPEVLAPIDQFHTRGFDATVQHAELCAPGSGMHVLDIGCGVGGPARYLAATYGCRVTGVDLTQAFVDAATMLTDRCGLAHLVEFRQANATALPFEDERFDMVWCQNVTMNIEDKAGFYREVHRVLKPRAPFASTEMAAGPAGEPYFPLPWAREPSINFLVPADEMRRLLLDSGFEIIEWRDNSRDVVASVEAASQRARRGSLGVALIAGEDFPARQANSTRSLADGKLVNLMVVAAKSR